MLRIGSTIEHKVEFGVVWRDIHEFELRRKTGNAELFFSSLRLGSLRWTTSLLSLFKPLKSFRFNNWCAWFKLVLVNHSVNNLASSKLKWKKAWSGFTNRTAKVLQREWCQACYINKKQETVGDGSSIERFLITVRLLWGNSYTFLETDTLPSFSGVAEGKLKTEVTPSLWRTNSSSTYLYLLCTQSPTGGLFIPVHVQLGARYTKPGSRRWLARNSTRVPGDVIYPVWLPHQKRRRNQCLLAIFEWEA